MIFPPRMTTTLAVREPTSTPRLIKSSCPPLESTFISSCASAVLNQRQHIIRGRRQRYFAAGGEGEAPRRSFPPAHEVGRGGEHLLRFPAQQVGRAHVSHQ